MPASARWFGRPLADFLAPVFYNLGCSANQATFIRAVMTVIALGLLATGEQALLYAAGVLGLIAFVLDFVDGHLARLDNNASFWGKFSDGLVDYIFPAFGPLAAGVGLSLQTQQMQFAAIGGLISMITLLTRTARDRLRYFQQWMIETTGALTGEEVEKSQPWRRGEYHISVIAANGRTLAFPLLFIPDGGFIFFVAIAVVQGLSEPTWLYICLKSGYATLNRWRKSVHASS